MYRRFLLARQIFIPVKLARQFYTILAAVYHVGTKHSLSCFIIAARTGLAISSILWEWFSGCISAKPIMWPGFLISTTSALLTLSFTPMGYAGNVWFYALVTGLL